MTPREFAGNVACLAVMIGILIPVIYFGGDIVKDVFGHCFKPPSWHRLERWSID